MTYLAYTTKASGTANYGLSPSVQATQPLQVMQTLHITQTSHQPTKSAVKSNIAALGIERLSETNNDHFGRLQFVHPITGYALRIG